MISYLHLQHFATFHSQHSSNRRLSGVFFQAIIQTLPPFKQHCVAYQLKPWSELQPVVLEHSLQLRRRDVSSILHFVGVCCVINVGLDEQYVVN